MDLSQLYSCRKSEQPCVRLTGLGGKVGYSGDLCQSCTLPRHALGTGTWQHTSPTQFPQAGPAGATAPAPMAYPPATTMEWTATTGPAPAGPAPPFPSAMLVPLIPQGLAWQLPAYQAIIYPPPLPGHPLVKLHLPSLQAVSSRLYLLWHSRDPGAFHQLGC